MNQLDNVLKSMTGWLDTIVKTGAKFMNDYGFFIVIVLIITAVAKVFNFKFKM